MTKCWQALSLLACLVVGACTSTSGISVDDLFSDTMRGLDAKGRPAKAGTANSRLLAASSENGTPVSGAYHEGSGSYVSGRAPAIEPGTMSDGAQGYTLNLVDAPIKAAAKSVLGDTLGVNYTVDPRVIGTMSLQTSAPVPRDELVDLFETSLSVAGASIVRRGAGYQIVPSTEALAGTPAVSVPSMSPKGPGVSVQVIELRFIGADEMRAILEPISRPGSLLRVDTTRNTLVISGTSQDLQSMRDAIGVFDVDWMKGRSVALHPLKNAKPAPVAAELEAIFGQAKESGMVRFVPNERMNAVLVIATRPVYLQRAAAWVRKLDQQSPGDSQQMFVYEIQNRPAKELAEVLQAVLKKDGGVKTPAAEPAAVAPDILPERMGDAPAGEGEGGAPPPAAQAVAFAGSGDSTDSESSDGTSVVADVENNALLISTTAKNYKRIERILRQLDALPTQVMLEAVIAEVTLTDQLKFGLRWAVESGKFRFNLTDAVTQAGTGVFGPALPGSAFGFISSDLQVTLNALASITDVNVVSSPTIMALNNQKAMLQVGDQVPILTQQSTGDATNSRTINSIEMRDTGLILTVTPRINAAGRVLLDIDQEVSNVAEQKSAGVDSPTIRQRRLRTKAIVNDGESIALGGLIQEENNLSRGQVPIAGDIPIFGNLFKNKTDKINRTELIIFIRPRIMRNAAEARDVTAEFRDKLTFDTALPLRRKGKTKLERDLNRLKY